MTRIVEFDVVHYPEKSATSTPASSGMAALETAMSPLAKRATICKIRSEEIERRAEACPS
jgi:hypothetical protein